MPEVPSSIDTSLPLEQRMQIFDRVRIRLIELCKEHNTWLAGGRMYLTNEDGQLICKDIATNQEVIILWGGEEYILEFDKENRYQRDFSRLPAELNFKVRKKGGGQQEIFLGAKIGRMTPEILLRFLSERSMELIEIPFDERMLHRGPSGELGPPKKVVFGKRGERETYEMLYPHFITLIVNDDYRSNISHDVNSDLSFSDLEKGDRLYPDLSNVSQSQLIKRHGREYIETKCWNAQTKRSKECLLSRPEGFGNFEKHYLQVGPNSFEVMHLVGHTHAEIKFLGGIYRADVDEQGNMKSKQQRYINLSGSSTFWYDLKEHKKLDHEPA